MRSALRHLPFIALVAALAAASPALADAPKVVASIKPVHSLVAAVMEGVAEPALIVRGAASPHTYAMKPSDARALAAADLVFWVGPELEGFLAKPLEANARKAQAVELLEAPGIALLDAREGGAWDAHGHGHAHGHKNAHEEVNTHIWLDPGNARAMVAAIAEALSAKDPANAAAYKVNADRTVRSIDALDAELKAALAPVAGKPFVVFHDAYQYFEKRFGLAVAGSVTVSPEIAPGADRIKAIRDRLRTLGAACVFSEPQFDPRVIDVLVEGTSAKHGVLDPEGATLEEGPGLYRQLIGNLATSLVDCLGG